MIRRSLIIPVVMTTAIFGLLVGLGFWQVERWGAKQRLKQRVAERIHAVPAPPPAPADWSALHPKADEYKRVTITGRFLHDRETYLYTLWSAEAGGQATQGWSVFTPMRMRDGAVVLVDRGFVPDQKRAPESRPASLVEGETSVTGLLRMPEPRGMFAAPDQPGKREFFTRDPKAMAAAVGLPEAAPFTVAADATPVPGGWPKGGNTRVSFPDNHLQYAATWFTLALCVLVLFAIWLRRANKAPTGAAATDEV